MLPRLRSTIRLPADKHLLQQLEFCVRKLLCREKDKDVVATVRKVRYILTFCSLKKQEFKKINTFQIFFFFFSDSPGVGQNGHLRTGIYLFISL